ncbi:MAG TPA: hypothetical protein P5538_00360 [Bacteroidales bacterium]|jgi:hypothetical protein|nr:hypothetical protein [Bacteroidales bacterium]HOL97221.1 hypothetical protein [Bacteroidales bacterium]HOM35513.1 hypothetical protein [Bacteroidales bacterium]HPD23866.1 hypothetical protein [Bacteroidales bacterium]HRS98790.1 hypothetical protein [Bacteroidales bacterium]
MKNFSILILAALVFACTPQNYYQLIETDTSTQNITSNYFFFENEDVIIQYNLWSNLGNGNFILHNKTNNDIFIDMKRSHFIVNDFAQTYFQNRHFNPKKIGTLNQENTDEESLKIPGFTKLANPQQTNIEISFNEERIICLPPHSKKIIQGFELQQQPIRDCRLYRFPKKTEITSIEFDKENSPITFRNRICYSFKEDFTVSKYIEDSFYIKKITNLPSTEFEKQEFMVFCGDSTDYRVKYYPLMKPNSYYILYKLEPSKFNH